MSGWECGIRDCGAVYEAVEELLAHQAGAHERHECRVCGAVVPEGFFAVQHAFEEHTRAEYLRAYGADTGDVRRRERVVAEVEATVDVAALRERLDDSHAEVEGLE